MDECKPLPLSAYGGRPMLAGTCCFADTQGLTLAHFRAQLEDLREHIAHIRAQLEHPRDTSSGSFGSYGDKVSLT